MPGSYPKPTRMPLWNGSHSYHSGITLLCMMALLNRVRRHTSQAPLPHTQKRNECVVGEPGNEAMAIHLRHSSCRTCVC